MEAALQAVLRENDQITASTDHISEYFRRLVEQALRRMRRFGQAHVQIFGSFASGLRISASSDVDMNVSIPDYDKEACEAAHELERLSKLYGEDVDAIKEYGKAAKALKQAAAMRNQALGARTHAFLRWSFCVANFSQARWSASCLPARRAGRYLALQKLEGQLRSGKPPDIVKKTESRIAALDEELALATRREASARARVSPQTKQRVLLIEQARQACAPPRPWRVRAWLQARVRFSLYFVRSFPPILTSLPQVNRLLRAELCLATAPPAGWPAVLVSTSARGIVGTPYRRGAHCSAAAANCSRSAWPQAQSRVSRCKKIVYAIVSAIRQARAARALCGTLNATIAAARPTRQRSTRQRSTRQRST
eukprot:3549346-Pleurochrysis_carterae.AAC.1